MQNFSNLNSWFWIQLFIISFLIPSDSFTLNSYKDLNKRSNTFYKKVTSICSIHLTDNLGIMEK